MAGRRSSPNRQLGVDIEGRETDGPRVTSDDPELQTLAQLEPDALRRRWRTLVGRPMPQGLGRPLTLRILAYREQARRYGDLDLASQRALAAVLVGSAGRSAGAEVLGVDADATLVEKAHEGSARLKAAKVGGAVPPTLPLSLAAPGTVLVREHAGTLHRVMALDDGFAWNGRTYDSLSKVALAITGTRWNGPRFFGLRATKQKPTVKPLQASGLTDRAPRSLQELGS